MSYKILFSNIGYAKGINGSLRQHLDFFGRHFYCAVPVQEQVLAQLKAIIKAENPDLCCFVEIDSGSFHSAQFNQIEALLDDLYSFHDIADKYGHRSFVGRLPLHRGKSNALLAKHALNFERLYFRNGTKRLIYNVTLPSEIPRDIHVFFAHFSLNKRVRMRQFEEVRKIILDTSGETILLADFNIFQGFKELFPLLNTEDLIVLNKESDPTFTFSGRRLALDLCLCSRSLAARLNLRIIPQPFSDHAALLVEIDRT
ncbi:MAG: endonuclease/exonuclease/phosphatase family protein [Alphaproteobacteria bacterium]|nr:endonuclease/exonuclease/phosphatase family protein [Alphaproteobacteria bacterium]